MKKVRFKETDEIHIMVVWRFAYCEARKGRWDRVVADRFRFLKRCKEIEHIISYIFTDNHRRKILKMIETMKNISP